MKLTTMVINMDYESTFKFLSDDNKFNHIYQECLSFENNLLNNLYTSSLRTGRVVCELLIKKLAQTNSKLRKRFFEVNENGEKPKNNLYGIIKGCYKEKLIDKQMKEKYFSVKSYGDANAHGENFDEYDLLDCQKVHKLLFEISLDCFKKLHEDDLEYDYLNDLKYDYNLDKLQPSKFTAEERKELVEKIYVDEIVKDNFIKYLSLNKIYLDKHSFNEIIHNYEKYLESENDYRKFLDSKKYIEEEDISELLSFFKPSVKMSLLNDLKKVNIENLTRLYPYLDTFSESFTIEDIVNIIDERSGTEQKIYNLIKKLAFKFLKDDLKLLTKELESEKVLDKDQYGREIEKFKKYKIIEEDFGLKIEEVDKNIFRDAEQKEAAKYDGDKPLVINAGPGSGKTRVIIERVEFLIEKGVDPSTILVITFTNEATNELRNRLKYESGLGEQTVSQMHISTVHGFCRYIINNFEKNKSYNYLERYGERSLFFNKHREELGFTGYYQAYDSDVALITGLYDNYFNFGLYSEDFANYLRAKNSFKITRKYREFVDDFQEKYGVFPSFDQLYDSDNINAHFHAKRIAIVESYPKYNKLLEDYYSCDDNTLLKKAYEILCRNKVPFNNVLIDEFQDTNHHFMKIFIKLLENCQPFKKLSEIKDSSDNYKSFTIVGDSDQSIYGWRGALPRHFDKFTSKKNRDNVKYVELHTNYRSTANIVDFNEELIKDKRSETKRLRAKKQYKAPVYFLNNGIGAEFKNIISLIKSLYNDKKIKKLSDIAVLFRTNEEAMNFSNKLKEKDIPFYLKGNKDLLDQNEVKSILILFWYLVDKNETKFIYRSDKFLNLKGMAADFNDEFFQFSDETKGILNSIQTKFEDDVVDAANKYSQKRLTYRVVFKKEFEFIEKVLSDVDVIDLSELNESGLRDLGMSNEHDIGFFLKLNEIKSRMYSEDNYKPTTLEVFTELIQINDFIKLISVRDSLDSKKIEKNLANVSRIIKDYERIMGARDYMGLFNYLNSVLDSYSSYIDESETFEDEVHVMTVHKSKGLEYPIVIIASLEDGSFPKEYWAGKWHTDIEYLKHKPESVSEEINNFNLEEIRMIYVAASRAKEILILSSTHLKPELFVKLKNNSNINTKTLTRRNFNIIPKIESSNSLSSNTYIQEVLFEDIMDDYIICPYKYYLSNETKFAVDVIDDDHVEMVLHRLLSGIHCQNNLTDEDIKLKVETILKRHNISIFEKDYDIISNVTNYWNEYGKNYKIIKKDYVVSKQLKKCDLKGTIDLIVEDDVGYSIVKFIGSDDKILDISFYELLLHYYVSALKEDKLFKEEKLNYIILHSLDTNSVQKFSIKDIYEKYSLRQLEKITSRIMDKKFIKKNNCEKCGYKKFCNN